MARRRYFTPPRRPPVADPPPQGEGGSKRQRHRTNRMSADADSAPKRGLDIRAASKDAALSAIVAFGLFALLIGFRTDQGPTGALIVWPRFEALSIVVTAVFVGSFVRTLFFSERTFDLAERVPPALKDRLAQIGRFAGPALLAFALLVPV